MHIYCRKPNSDLDLTRKPNPNPNPNPNSDLDLTRKVDSRREELRKTFLKQKSLSLEDGVPDAEIGPEEDVLILKALNDELCEAQQRMLSTPKARLILRLNSQA